MSILKSKIEAILYAADEPITVDAIASVLREEILAAEAEEAAAREAEAAASEQTALETAGSERTEEADADSESLSVEPEAIEAAMNVAAEAAAASDDEAQGSSAQESKPVDPKAEAKAAERELKRRLAKRVQAVIDELTTEFAESERAMEIKAVAGGYRMATKPEHHDVVKSFAKSLKPPMRLSLQALETLAVIAYKQPVTVPEISEIRGVDSQGVIATLIDRKLITTAGRKQVIGRPMLYKTSKEFLLKFGLKDIGELPTIEEFEKLAQSAQDELFTPVADATGVPDTAEARMAVSEESAPEDSPEAAAEQVEVPAEAAQNTAEEHAHVGRDELSN